MSSPADAFIQMERPKQQEGGNDGFRDAVPEKFPGELMKWREKLTIYLGAELKKAGYVQAVDPDEAFILGGLSAVVLETMRSGVPEDSLPGQWVRHLHDLSQLSWQRVRLNEKSNPLADLANVNDSESALRFVKRYGFPVAHHFGLFESEAFSRANPSQNILFALPRPVASVDAILLEANFLRAIARLKEAQRREVAATTLREIERVVRLFAEKERLPAMTLDESLRLSKQGETAPPSVEGLWTVALQVADSRLNRLVRPSNALRTNPVVYEAHSILGFIYWNLRRYFVGRESILRQCSNPGCLKWFKPATEATIHCSPFCRRQFYEQNRSRTRSKSKSQPPNPEESQA